MNQARNFIFIVLVSLSSDALGMAHRAPAPTPSPTPIAIPLPSVAPGGDKITFKCASDNVCTSTEKVTVAKMQPLLNRVIQSQCFADHFILEKYRSQLVQTNGLTRQEVVKVIQNAVILDIPLSFYYKNNGTIGYTYPDDPTIYLNRKFRSGDWSICSEVSNELHEATHKMGFVHDYNRTVRRPYSVPYTANYASDACCPALLQ